MKGRTFQNVELDYNFPLINVNYIHVFHCKKIVYFMDKELRQGFK